METCLSFGEFPDFVRFQLPVLVWMGLIFVLSSLPGSTLSPLEFKDAHLIAHLLLFGMLYYLGYRALRFQNYSRLLREFSLLAALLFVMLYGATDEYHQSFTPGRRMELKDFLWDVLASVIVLLIVIVADKVKQNRGKLETR